MLFICDFDEFKHLEGVRKCFAELQDFERTLDPRMPSGADIVDAYIPFMLSRCKKCNGNVLVADVNGEVAGFVTILTKVKSDEIEEGDLEYGLVPNLIVAKKFRNYGIGKKLLEAAESYAMEKNVKWLRIGVFAENQAANKLYESMGFKSLFLEREKKLRQL
jgi:ribosomal protein S18 acetylase RimI-like enzyme